MYYPKKSEALKRMWKNLSQEEYNHKVSGVRALGVKRIINRIGLRYGKLTVVASAGQNKHGQLMWECVCDCGNRIPTIVTGNQLGCKKTISCSNCGRSRQGRRTHGKTNTVEYRMFQRVKTRAKRKGMEFSLKFTDIVVPDVCPVFGTPLKPGTHKDYDFSPSLDRLDNSKGYIKENVWVISKKANMIKNNSTLPELRAWCPPWKGG